LLAFIYIRVEILNNMAFLKNLKALGKKGQVGLTQIISSLGIAVILGAVFLSVLSNTRDTFTPASSEFNATQTGIDAINTHVFGNLGLIALVLVMAIVITAVIFLRRKTGQ